jgi:lysophospholipase L1-like esterase
MSQQAYAALGDSLTAGQGDLDAQGRPIGWARRLCSLLTARTGQPYLFTNLAVNRATVAEVLADQLPALRGAHPDLITLSTGINDIRGAFRKDAFAARIDRALAGATAKGATVATMTLPNIVSMLPLPTGLLSVAGELMEQANDAIRCAARAHGVLFVDAWYSDEVADPTFWSDDRVHPNARGHQLIAEAFADLLLSTSTLAGARRT